MVRAIPSNIHWRFHNTRIDYSVINCSTFKKKCSFTCFRFHYLSLFRSAAIEASLWDERFVSFRQPLRCCFLLLFYTLNYEHRYRIVKNNSSDNTVGRLFANCFLFPPEYSKNVFSRYLSFFMHWIVDRIKAGFGGTPRLPIALFSICNIEITSLKLYRLYYVCLYSLC